jgi:hypothetical protein
MEKTILKEKVTQVWSYGVKFLCGYVKEAPPGVMPVTSASMPSVRTGIYATEVNILNYQQAEIKIRKYFYPLVWHNEPIGREPKYSKRKLVETIGLPPFSATFDDCFHLHEVLDPGGTDEISIGIFEILSPVELNVTAVYTVNNLKCDQVDVEVVQIKGNLVKIKGAIEL